MPHRHPFLDTRDQVARVFDARVIGAVVLIVGLLYAATAARAAETTSSSEATGRLNFEDAKLPPANVEVDLTQGMFQDLFGISDAALAGVAETLLKSTGDKNLQGTKLAAEKLEAARMMIQLAGNVVREVRVRLYKDMGKESDSLKNIGSQFDEQLQAKKWETLVRVRDDRKTVRLSALRSGGAVHGVFVLASDDHNLVLANIVCDVSPENVKKLTATATKIGLDNGLAQQLEMQMRHSPGMAQPRPTIIIQNGKAMVTGPAPVIMPAPPTPPAPPAAPAKPAKPAKEKHKDKHEAEDQ